MSSSANEQIQKPKNKNNNEKSCFDLRPRHDHFLGMALGGEAALGGESSGERSGDRSGGVPE